MPSSRLRGASESCTSRSFETPKSRSLRPGAVRLERLALDELEDLEEPPVVGDVHVKRANDRRVVDGGHRPGFAQEPVQPVELRGRRGLHELHRDGDLGDPVEASVHHAHAPGAEGALHDDAVSQDGASLPPEVHA